MLINELNLYLIVRKLLTIQNLLTMITFEKQAELISNATGEIRKKDILDILNSTANTKDAANQLTKKYDLGIIDAFIVRKVLCPETINKEYERAVIKDINDTYDARTAKEIKENLKALADDLK